MYRIHWRLAVRHKCVHKEIPDKDQGGLLNSNSEESRLIGYCENMPSCMALVGGTRSRIVTSRSTIFPEKSQDSGASSTETRVCEEEGLKQTAQSEQEQSYSSQRSPNSNMLQDLPAWNVRCLRSHGVVMGAAWIAEAYIQDLYGNADAQDNTVLDSLRRKFSATQRHTGISSKEVTV